MMLVIRACQVVGDVALLDDAVAKEQVGGQSTHLQVRLRRQAHRIAPAPAILRP
jgi:hypothetical protein